MGIMDKMRFWKHDSSSTSQPQQENLDFSTHDYPSGQPHEMQDHTMQQGMHDDFRNSHNPEFDDLNLGLPQQDSIMDNGFAGQGRAMDDDFSEAHGIPQQGSQFTNPRIRHSGFGAGVIDPNTEPIRSEPQYQGQHSANKDTNIEKNLEIISSKIDTLKIMVESISQRLTKIEMIAEHEQNTARTKRPEW
ncbi:hypothetical protein JXB31_01990 [Candidatus Woesearchaeota archaeon]|nr:hypothetical protein [Candidatus Woesearchaeota archaeon]